MSSTSFNAQFLTIDFRLLDSPDYCVFMRASAFPLYLQLRRYIWRGTDTQHPIDKVNELYAQGYLVCAIPRKTLAKKLEISEPSHISRQLSDLESRGVIRKVRTGRQNVIVLGTWEDRSFAQDRSYVLETFFLEQRHGAEPFDQPRLGDLPPGLPEPRPVPKKDAAQRATRGSAGFQPRASDTSDVSQSPPSDVSQTPPSDVSLATPFNKEVNREENRGWDALPSPRIPIPEGIRIPIPQPGAPDAAASGRRRGSRFAGIPPAPPFGKGGGRLLADASERHPGGKVLPMRQRESTTTPDVLRVVLDKEASDEPDYPVIHVRL